MQLDKSPEAYQPNGTNMLYWLLWSYMGAKREGWEEGPNEREINDAVHSFLCNCELDPNLPLAQRALQEGSTVLEQFEQCCECMGNQYDPRDDVNLEGPCSFCNGKGYRLKT